MASNRALKVDTPQQSRDLLLAVLDNSSDTAVRAARDIVLLNAGVALYAADVASSMGDGIVKARAALESGAARQRLDQLVAASQALSQAG